MHHGRVSVNIDGKLPVMIHRINCLVVYVVKVFELDDEADSNEDQEGA